LVELLSILMLGDAASGYDRSLTRLQPSTKPIVPLQPTNSVFLTPNQHQHKPPVLFFRIKPAPVTAAASRIEWKYMDYFAK